MQWEQCSAVRTVLCSKNSAVQWKQCNEVRTVQQYWEHYSAVTTVQCSAVRTVQWSENSSAILGTLQCSENSAVQCSENSTVQWEHCSAVRTVSQCQFSENTLWAKAAASQTWHFTMPNKSLFNTWHFKMPNISHVINRPSVAGAVLQSPSLLIHSFINSVSHPFPPNLHNINNPKRKS